MLSLLIASLILPWGVLAQDCTIVKNAWKAMGKPAVRSNTDCCKMTGVTCSGGYVTEISWSNQGLTGPIPSSLGNLTRLTKLYLNNNKLTNVPSSLSNLRGIPSGLSGVVQCPTIALLSNPISLIPYDVIVKNPVSTLSTQNLTKFLATPKNGATLTTDQLLAMCPLNYVANQDILAGCVAGIVYFCQGQTDLTQCHRYYEKVFSWSIFSAIGAYCPAWKDGPNSLNCANAVNGFSVSLGYTTVNKDFMTFFAKTLFTNKAYAPCNSAVQKCNW